MQNNELHNLVPWHVKDLVEKLNDRTVEIHVRDNLRQRLEAMREYIDKALDKFTKDQAISRRKK